MTITITAFERSPMAARGWREIRACAGARGSGPALRGSSCVVQGDEGAAHLALHPFGQIPTFEDGDVALFETGAIVFHIAERHAGLCRRCAARARAITWMFAALSTIEPPILELATPGSPKATSPGRAQRMPLVVDRLRERLVQLSHRLGDADWLDGAFSAGDLIMVSVLLRLKASGLLNEFPNLSTFVARGEARPAYKRAFDAQLAVNSAPSPTA